MVPHLDMTAASSTSDGAGPAFVVSLLGVDDKRGSNRGNDKIVVVTVAAQARRSLLACLTLTTRLRATGTLVQWQGGSGGGAGPAFVAGLLGVEVEDKRVSG